MDITALLHARLDNSPRSATPTPPDDSPREFSRLLQQAGTPASPAPLKGLARVRPEQTPVLLEPRLQRGEQLTLDTRSPAPDTLKAATSRSGGEHDKPRGDDATPPPTLAMTTVPTPASPGAAAEAAEGSAAATDDVTALPASAAETGRDTRITHTRRFASGHAASGTADDDGDSGPAPIPAHRQSGARPAATPMTGDAAPAAPTPASASAPTPDPSLSTATAPVVASASSAAGHTAPAPASTPTATLSAPVGSDAWQHELGQQLIRLGRNGDHQVRLQLHPAELGSMQVNLHFNHDGAQAQFLALHAQARDAIQQALPQLREALSQHGIALGEATVGQQQNGHDERNPHADAPAWNGDRHGDVEPLNVRVSPPARTAPIPLHAAGVDLYA